MSLRMKSDPRKPWNILICEKCSVFKVFLHWLLLIGSRPLEKLFASFFFCLKDHSLKFNLARKILLYATYRWTKIGRTVLKNLKIFGSIQRPKQTQSIKNLARDLLNGSEPSKTLPNLMFRTFTKCLDFRFFKTVQPILVHL